MQRTAKGDESGAGTVDQLAAGGAQVPAQLRRHPLHFDGTQAAGFLFNGNCVEGEHDISFE